MSVKQVSRAGKGNDDMIGKMVTALAGNSIAKSIGGASAGPIGLAIGAAVPVILPRVARRFGPLGMVTAAVGTMVLTRYVARRAEERHAAEAAKPVAPAVPLPTGVAASEAGARTAA